MGKVWASPTFVLSAEVCSSTVVQRLCSEHRVCVLVSSSYARDFLNSCSHDILFPKLYRLECVWLQTLHSVIIYGAICPLFVCHDFVYNYSPEATQKRKTIKITPLIIYFTIAIYPPNIVLCMVVQISHLSRLITWS